MNWEEALVKIRSAESFENHFYQKNKMLGRNVEEPTSTVVPVREPGKSRVIGIDKIYFSNHPNPKLRNTIRRTAS